MVEREWTPPSDPPSQRQPIRGYNFAPAMFLLEIQLQCDLAERMIARLESGVQGWLRRPPLPAGVERPIDRIPPIEAIATIAALLSAAAMVSRTLFATSPRAAEQRAAALRKLLGDPDLPVLRSRSTRNSLEHLDQRLDAFLSSQTGETVGGMNLYISMTEEGPTKGHFVPRRVDPRSLVLTVAGEAIDLCACARELALVQERLSAAFQQLSGPEVRLWDP